MSITLFSRRTAVALAFAVASGCLQAQTAPPRAVAAYAGPLFDAHLHYNEEAFDTHPVADVLGRLVVVVQVGVEQRAGIGSGRARLRRLSLNASAGQSERQRHGGSGSGKEHGRHRTIEA